MKNIQINFANNTIEITKNFSKEASYYGSEAYNELMGAKRDFPTYTVIVKAAPKRKANAYKGLNYEYMKKYIIKNSGEESEQMKDFNTLCGNTDEEFAVKASFGKVKKWFLATYPEIEESRERVNEIIAKAKEEREAKCKTERKAS